MPRPFRDAEHLLRLAGLFLAGVVAFLAARALLVPADFGDYGHYRAGALDDNRDRRLSHAGREACAECHGDVVAARHGSRHERIGCESCHGPLAAHAADPDAMPATAPAGDETCLVCHLDTAERPPSFPQVTPEEHAGDTRCADCHSPHHPEP